MGEWIQVTRFLTAIRAAIAAFLATWRGTASITIAHEERIEAMSEDLRDRAMATFYGVKSPKPWAK
jgi:hypothetical protein